MRETSGFTVIAGDRVLGALETLGIQEVLIVEQMTMDAEVLAIVRQGTNVGLVFYQRCDRPGLAPLGGW
jgi:hypothetical protein